jgi:hypothetical protein
MSACYLLRFPQPSIRIAYVYVPHNGEYRDLANRFFDFYDRFPPTCPHRLTVIWNGFHANAQNRNMPWHPNTEVWLNDNTGWDIGAYIKLASETTQDMLVCFGSHATIRRREWLDRLVEAWRRHGPGMYGCTASHEVRPHLNSSGFACSPALLSAYPVPMINQGDRYFFEHGSGAFWRLVQAAGFPVKLVTADGEFDWRDWRKAADIYYRGNQSQCLCWFRACEIFNASPPGRQAALSHLADTLQDPEFVEMRAGTPAQDIERSRAYFERTWHIDFGARLCTNPTPTAVLAASAA